MGSSADKIEVIFEIIRDLDGLDEKAWTKLISEAEGKREKEIMENKFRSVERSEVILNMVLPLVKLTRLVLASEEVDSFMRTVIVRPLIQELLYLFTPIEAAGVLQSLIYTSFEKGRPQPIPMMIIPAQAMKKEREDSSRTVV